MKKIYSTNKIIEYKYFIYNKYETGIILSGDEVKSIKLGGASLRDSFCFINKNNEIFIKNININTYKNSFLKNKTNTKRDIKLLLHKLEIIRIKSKMQQQNLTLIPVCLYNKHGLIKVELALCKGKHEYDKKQTLKEKDLKLMQNREIKNISI